MDNFDAHKWFKKEYLGEGHTEDKTERDQFIRRYDQLSDDDKLKLAKIQAMMDRERSLKEDDLNESIIESQFDDLYQVVRNIHHVGEYGSLEEAAEEAMERIGQEFGVNFEFGRG